MICHSSQTLLTVAQRAERGTVSLKRRAENKMEYFQRLKEKRSEERDLGREITENRGVWDESGKERGKGRERE